MIQAKQHAAVIFFSTGQLPDYYTDETVLKAKNDYESVETILINKATGEIRVTDTDKTLRTFKVKEPLDTKRLFAAVSRTIEKKTVIVTDNILSFSNEADEAAFCYLELIKNPLVEIHFFHSGWLDSSVYRSLRLATCSPEVAFKLMSDIIKKTYSTFPGAYELMEQQAEYNNLHEYSSMSKKKR